MKKLKDFEGQKIAIHFTYSLKINTERSEAITTAKELITKFDIKQEEIY